MCGGTEYLQNDTAPHMGLSPRVRGNRLHFWREFHRDGSIPACAGEPMASKSFNRITTVYPPRVRGNRVAGGGGATVTGSIPACAGEPGHGRRCCPLSAVYPRVCGGTYQIHRRRILPKGLSPRVRGNHIRPNCHCKHRRSIPACAGEPQEMEEDVEIDEVYPRVCGGTTSTSSYFSHDNGLSPRVRGNLQYAVQVGAVGGSIPACAGEPLKSVIECVNIGVYPRVCGGTQSRSTRD